MDGRNQTLTTSSTCFKCKATLPSLAALELHLRSCITEWEPPQSVPWTFIPPPDILVAPGPAMRDAPVGGGSRGRGSSRRGGTQKAPLGSGSHGKSKSSPIQAEDKGASGSYTRGGVGRRGGGGGRGASDGKTERGGKGGGRGGGNRGSARAGKQNASNPEPNSGSQRGGYQKKQGRRSSIDSIPNQTLSGSPKSNQTRKRNGVPSSPDEAQVNRSHPKGLTCSKCQLSFANSQELVNHFNTSPAHPNSGFPPPSPSSTSTLPALQPHSPASGTSHCTKCDIRFDCPDDLADHFRESENHPFTLPIIGYRYSVPVFNVEDSRFQFGVFGPKADVTEEEHKEATIKRADYRFEDIDEEEAELICAMRRVDFAETMLVMI